MRAPRALTAAFVASLLWLCLGRDAKSETPALLPLPAAAKIDPKKAELGRMLFFDKRLSGDAEIACADCHSPAQAWSDGLPLSRGYPGTSYFRRTPSLLDVALRRRLYWDGRLDGRDMDSLVRDHLTEAHFMNADGRLLIERLRQVPEYEAAFKAAMGGEPSFGRILGAITAFVATLRTDGGALDRHLSGKKKLTGKELEGYQLFTGKAACTRCHSGATLTDESFHVTGVPESGAVFSEPLRHITFRRFFKTMGVADYAQLRADVGRYAQTQVESDRGAFRTPSLRNVGAQAAFMHNGSLATLSDVVAFYDAGAGVGPDNRPRLTPLGLSGAQKAALVAFLKVLKGSSTEVVPPASLPAYAPRKLGEN